MATPQAALAPLTRDAIFLTAVLTGEPGADDMVKRVLGGLSDLVNAVDSRGGISGGNLSCVAGISFSGWHRLFGLPRPAKLHPFRELHGEKHVALATAGDLLFHIRSDRMDLCFELAMNLVHRLGSAVEIIDETHGFFYFEDRDLIGFVDGTENPKGDEAAEAVIIGDEEPDFTGGSYVHVQKYQHDMVGWNALKTEQQELIIGREKLSNIELDDDTKPSWAHNALTNIEEDGVEQAIVRHNMPYGSVAKGELGTYFIGYARNPDITERMLRNMFLGDPPGNYDHLLDYSHPVTGAMFFAPSLDFLDALSS
jgi:putative iron-dependent peroxidase